MYRINIKDLINVARTLNITHEELIVPSSVILTFNNQALQYLVKKYSLNEWNWKGEQISPYASLRRYLNPYKGTLENELELAVFYPPMGASPLTAFCEELILWGAKYIILVCSSWGLGEKYLQKRQIHLPNFAVGLDGTSPHYGNNKMFIKAEQRSYEAISSVLRLRNVNWKEGGIGSCEAIYRITDEMILNYKEKGCLSMDNGEVASLFTLAKVYKIPIGVILQSYINLEHGLDLSYIDESYINTCKDQASIAVDALEYLWKQESRIIKNDECF